MAVASKIICPSCGFSNTPPLANNRCVSCGAKIEDLKRSLTRQEELERRYQQEGFSLLWFGVSIAIMSVMTAALVMGLPMVVPAFDFEGSAGMRIAIPVWFLGGMLIGLISPGKTFIEPMVAFAWMAARTEKLRFFPNVMKSLFSCHFLVRPP